MHPINSATGDSSMVNNQNSNSSTSMQKSANIQFVSDMPITDPGQSSKVSEAIESDFAFQSKHTSVCAMFMTHFCVILIIFQPPRLLFSCFALLCSAQWQAVCTT